MAALAVPRLRTQPSFRILQVQAIRSAGAKDLCVCRAWQLEASRARWVPRHPLPLVFVGAARGLVLLVTTETTQEVGAPRSYPSSPLIRAAVPAFSRVAGALSPSIVTASLLLWAACPPWS